MRIAVIGRTSWLYDTVVRLAGDNHQIALIVTADARPEYTRTEQDFRELADKLGCPFVQTNSINTAEAIETLRESEADVAVSVNWPTLIRAQACGIFPNGILNSHAGDLPRYRGNACPNWAILNGERRIGLCIHKMDPHEVDAGPVVVRRYLPIDESTYIEDVYRWFDTVVPEAFSQSLELLAQADFSPEIQAGQRPMRCFPRRPDDGAIDWTRSATEIARLVRASSRPFAGAFAMIEGRGLYSIWRARPIELPYDVCAVPGQVIGAQEGLPIVACGRGALVVEDADNAGGGPPLKPAVSLRFVPVTPRPTQETA